MSLEVYLSSLATVIIPSCHECSDSVSPDAARQQISINGYVLHPCCCAAGFTDGTHLHHSNPVYVAFSLWLTAMFTTIQIFNHTKYLMKKDFHLWGSHNTTIQYKLNCVLMDSCGRLWMTKGGCSDFLINQWQRLKKNKIRSKVNAYAETPCQVGFFFANVMKTCICKFFFISSLLWLAPKKYIITFIMVRNILHVVFGKHHSCVWPKDPWWAAMIDKVIYHGCWATHEFYIGRSYGEATSQNNMNGKSKMNRYHGGLWEHIGLFIDRYPFQARDRYSIF